MTRGSPLSPQAGRGPAAPRGAAGKRGRSRSDGEGELPEEAPPFAPPHRRLPPRFADDEVGKALSPTEVGPARLRQAGSDLGQARDPCGARGCAHIKAPEAETCEAYCVSLRRR
ncbi:hypothetical protein FV222_18955 [Methylobacterium sp. WL103]|nr:hypothetical protein FV226_23665 [Methylobacterium sp. WL12]TXM96141.1 hypothetical protein FV222_18955 [Methylobacterium sp. WL103]